MSSTAHPSPRFLLPSVLLLPRLQPESREQSPGRLSPLVPEDFAPLRSAPACSLGKGCRSGPLEGFVRAGRLRRQTRWRRGTPAQRKGRRVVLTAVGRRLQVLLKAGSQIW